MVLEVNDLCRRKQIFADSLWKHMCLYPKRLRGGVKTTARPLLNHIASTIVIAAWFCRAPEISTIEGLTSIARENR